jgi:hypothetical protein
MGRSFAEEGGREEGCSGRANREIAGMYRPEGEVRRESGAQKHTAGAAAGCDPLMLIGTCQCICRLLRL